MSHELKESVEDFVNNVMFQSIISENMDCTNVVENSKVNSETDKILLNVDRKSSEKFPCSDPGQNVGKNSLLPRGRHWQLPEGQTFTSFKFWKTLIDHVVQGRNFK